MSKEIEIVDRHAYQEFIYCPYCGHWHGQVSGWENWGMVFHVICERCSYAFVVSIIQLVVLDEGDRAWLGIGFDSERDDTHFFNRDQSFSPTGRLVKHNPPIQNIARSLADELDKLLWR
jgi:hypothetical protein